MFHFAVVCSLFAAAAGVTPPAADGSAPIDAICLVQLQRDISEGHARRGPGPRGDDPPERGGARNQSAGPENATRRRSGALPDRAGKKAVFPPARPVAPAEQQRQNNSRQGLSQSPGRPGGQTTVFPPARPAGGGERAPPHADRLGLLRQGAGNRTAAGTDARGAQYPHPDPDENLRRCPCCVTLFADDFFSGRAEHFFIGEYPGAYLDLIGFMDNAVSSLIVWGGPACLVSLYQYPAFNGWQAIFPPGYYDYGRAIYHGFQNDDVSSFRVWLLDEYTTSSHTSSTTSSSSSSATTTSTATRTSVTTPTTTMTTTTPSTTSSRTSTTKTVTDTSITTKSTLSTLSTTTVTSSLTTTTGTTTTATTTTYTHSHTSWTSSTTTVTTTTATTTTITTTSATSKTTKTSTTGTSLTDTSTTETSTTQTTTTATVTHTSYTYTTQTTTTTTITVTTISTVTATTVTGTSTTKTRTTTTQSTVTGSTVTMTTNTATTKTTTITGTTVTGTETTTLLSTTTVTITKTSSSSTTLMKTLTTTRTTGSTMSTITTTPTSTTTTFTEMRLRFANAGFERGATTATYEVMCGIQGWGVTPSTVDSGTLCPVVSKSHQSPSFVHGGTNAADGQYFLGLRGQGSAITQTVPRHTVGQAYRLLFHIAKSSAASQDPVVRVTVGGQSMGEFAAAMTSMSRVGVTYVPATHHTVEFKFENISPDQSETVYIDRVYIKEGLSTPARCEDLMYFGRVWGTAAAGVDVGTFTGGQLKWIGCMGQGCPEDSLFCHDAAGYGLELGTTSALPLRASFGPSFPTGPTTCATAVTSGGILSAVSSNADAHSLCQQLGYTSGQLQSTGLASANNCPSVQWDSGTSTWTSDYSSPPIFAKSILCLEYDTTGTTTSTSYG